MEKCYSNRKRFKNNIPKEILEQIHLQIIWFGRDIVKQEIVMVLLVKFVKAVIQRDKKPIKTK